MQVWKIKVPQNALHTVWRILHNRLPTKNNLQARNVDVGDQRCVFCRAETEIVEHLFFHCVISRKIWMECYNWGKITTMVPNCAAEHFLQHKLPALREKGDRGWKAVWIAIVNSI